MLILDNVGQKVKSIEWVALLIVWSGCRFVWVYKFILLG